MTLGISDEEFENAIDEAARSKRIDLAHAREFTIGPVRVVPALRTITGPDSEEVIEPKVMQVLVALSEGVGATACAILSRDDLIERCWEGRIVGESSINRVVSLLRSALKSVCGDTVKVENVPKVGYRLLLDPDWKPSEALAVAPGLRPVSASDGQATRSGSMVLALGVAALLAIIAATYSLWPSAEPAPVEKLKVAMLPLKTSEGVDPLYARGLEAELRSQLARVGRFQVTRSDSARQLFDEGLSADEICRKLGADYAWVGSLDVQADRVSLTANLIEAGTKQSAFRQTLSSAPSAAQTLPLRTARAITTALGRPVSERLPDPSVSAGDYRLYLTALGLIKGRGIEQRQAALEIMEQVTAQNPNFADGWAGLAKAYFLLPTPEKADMLANRVTAGEFADKALELDPDTVDAIKVKGMLDSTSPAERIALLERATQLDPGDSEAWYWLAIVQGEFALEAGSPLDSARRLIEIDPLWPASWRASDLAAQYGDIELAFSIEDAVTSAAVTPSQRLLSQARRAMLDGDLSGFVQHSREAQQTATPAERQYGAKMQSYTITRLLNLPRPDMDEMMGPMSGAIYEAAREGRLPSRGELAANGEGGAQFWESLSRVEMALPLFLRDGREAELIEYYDAAFASRSNFLARANEDGQAHNSIPRVSPYLALAFQRMGRDEDAAWHIAQVREQVDRWKAADTGSIDGLFYELVLAALDGDEAGATGLVSQLGQYNWPYTMVHVRPTTTTLLGEDPLYAPIRDLPEVKAVLDPIRANLAKEREEVLALGV